MLKWCVVGSGDVVNRLVNNSLNIKNKSKVITIISNNKIQGELLTKKINAENFLIKSKKNLNYLLNNEKINSVYIATPPKFHFEYIKFFSKTKKNIICEKPLVIKLNHLKQIIKLKKKYKFNLLTCFYRRHLDRFLYIKRILDKKVIGKIVYFNIRYFHNEKNHPTANILKENIPWRFKKKISGGGNIVDMGIHSIDLINFFMNDIKYVSGYTNNNKKIYNVEDSTIVNFKLRNGITGQGSWCSVASHKQDAFEIYGTKGFIKFSTNYNEDENLYIFKNGKTKKIKLSYNLPLHKNMMRSFVNLLIKNNKKRLYTFSENGIKTVEILSKIIKF